MTNVRCTNDRDEYTIDIEGHAGYNPGNDIVCAGASILGFTLMNALMDQDAITKEISFEDATGEIHIKIEGDKITKFKIKTIIETVMCGYELLMEQYPANVSVEW